MSWLDRLRRRRPSPRTVTRGEDVALFAPPSLGSALQMGLGREGWNARVFTAPDRGVWDALVRNLPLALLVVEGEGVMLAEIRKAVARRPALAGLPLLVGGVEEAPDGVFAVPEVRAEVLAEALAALH